MQRCADCGKRCKPQKHHDPPKCEGGTNTIDLCRRCHVRRHCANNDWARWGQKGGKQTAKDPNNYRRNLKQYQRPPWKTDVIEDYVL